MKYSILKATQIIGIGYSNPESFDSLYAKNATIERTDSLIILEIDISSNARVKNTHARIDLEYFLENFQNVDYFQFSEEKVQEWLARLWKEILNDKYSPEVHMKVAVNDRSYVYEVKPEASSGILDLRVIKII